MNKLVGSKQFLLILFVLAVLAAFALWKNSPREIALDIRNSLPAQHPYSKSADPELLALLSQVDPDYASNEWTGEVIEGEVIDVNDLPTSMADTPYYVYGNPDGHTYGAQRFGTQNKVGVEHAVIQAHGDRVSDFEYIRDNSSPREQFLQNLGYQFRLPGRHWHVHVSKAMNVNGGARLHVWAYAGTDREDGSSDFDGYLVNEVWRIGTGSNPPTLIERSHWTKLGEQCKTLAELGLQPNSPELGQPWDANLSMGIGGY